MGFFVSKVWIKNYIFGKSEKNFPKRLEKIPISYVFIIPVLIKQELYDLLNKNSRM